MDTLSALPDFLWENHRSSLDCELKGQLCRVLKVYVASPNKKKQASGQWNETPLTIMWRDRTDQPIILPRGLYPIWITMPWKCWHCPWFLFCYWSNHVLVDILCSGLFGYSTHNLSVSRKLSQYVALEVCVFWMFYLSLTGWFYACAQPMRDVVTK